MINDLINEIQHQQEKDSKYFIDTKVKRNLIGLLILKYYCDTGILSYEEVIKQNNVENISFPIDTFEYELIDVPNTKLLALIQYENLQDIVKEYLSDSKIGINIISSDEEKICISNNLNKSVYDITGKTTYVTDKYKINIYEIAVFKFFDKVLGINNKYINFDELIIENYKYVYIFDDTPRYRFIKNSDNDVYDLIRKLFMKSHELKIIFHTDYKKISNIKESRSVIKYMSKVVLFEDGNTLVFYEVKSDDKVSIINYNSNKIESLSKLQQVIEQNRKTKDILVKVTLDDIAKNYYRIGFRLYQFGIEKGSRNINEIADENTKLIEELSRLNKGIEQEINKLINR